MGVSSCCNSIQVRVTIDHRREDTKITRHNFNGSSTINRAADQMAALKALSEQLLPILSLIIALLTVLGALAKLIKALRPYFRIIFTVASLIIPHGMTVWIFIYRTAEASNNLRGNPSGFLFLIALLSGFSIFYTVVWGWCVWRLYPKLRGQPENQLQKSATTTYDK